MLAQPPFDNLIRCQPLFVAQPAIFDVQHDGSAFVIDRFLAELDGLVLSEVGAETDDALAAIPFPSFAALEVTEREEFTGGALADAAPDDVLALARKLIGGRSG